MRFSTPHGFYELNAFPGCNQLVVSNHAFIERSERGRGVGNEAHQNRLEHIKELGYDAVVCTCIETNFKQVRILVKNGWHRVFRFYNRETENWIGLWVRGIEQEDGQSKVECENRGEDQAPRSWTLAEIEDCFKATFSNGWNDAAWKYMQDTLLGEGE